MHLILSIPSNHCVVGLRNFGVDVYAKDDSMGMCSYVLTTNA